ncbi:Uncharacterized protein conserved in bacteria [Nocardia otitidiscaviarum]|uniref:Uncharacterized protein conserved in bacteria n=1 Tax=Nocardia otitidiscaviarum TaxID=1823 RepID=A0A378YQ26_9NOCA|nr:YdeI/OmpD-associated family protein [Nocardia otitidiscaviarum]SUA79305.1 Uncharacterized protein conserved in bacteria [Nocardia otitidiscaviarum]
MTTVVARNAAEWRAWLAEHSHTTTEAWLVIRHIGCGIPSVRMHEAMEQALCFGWIDSVHRTYDADSSILRFTPRGPRSSWSKVNRDRAARLIEQGLMTERGRAVIERARTEGTWQPLPDAAATAIPTDLRCPLERNAVADENFRRFPPSSKRLILEWIASAKRPETRARRIARTVELAARNQRANHPGVRIADD